MSGGEAGPRGAGAEGELILREADAERRADLLACPVMLAARYFEKGLLRRHFREEEIMREASVLEELLADQLEERLEKGLQKGLRLGLQQGFQEGLRQARLADIQYILRWRFGDVPVALVVQLASLTASQLEHLLGKALEVPDLEAIQVAVDELHGAEERRSE